MKIDGYTNHGRTGCKPGEPCELITQIKFAPSCGPMQRYMPEVQSLHPNCAGVQNLVLGNVYRQNAINNQIHVWQRCGQINSMTLMLRVCIVSAHCMLVGIRSTLGRSR